MSREKLLRILASLVLAMAVLHIGAIIFDLYWNLWWYDIALHFLGGVFVALLVLWLCFFSGYFPVVPIGSKVAVFWLAFLSTLAIGAGWEIFERLAGHIWSPEGYWLDTMSDVACDVAGGLLGYLLFIRKVFPHV